MPHYFDLEEKRSNQLSSGALPLMLKICREPLEKLRTERVLTARSSTILNEAALAIIVGLREPGLQLAEKVLEWVSIAIDEQERPMYYSPKGTEAQRYACKAFALWLLGRPIDSELVELFVANSTEYRLGEGKDKIGISLSLPEYVALEAYEPALDVWQQCGKFQPPPAIEKITSEANMCYVVANHRLGREYSADDEQLALSRFLKRNVDAAWLARGHAMRVATWMKIAYWKPGDDPIETVMRCHEFLKQGA